MAGRRGGLRSASLPVVQQKVWRETPGVRDWGAKGCVVGPRIRKTMAVGARIAGAVEVLIPRIDLFKRLLLSRVWIRRLAKHEYKAR